MRIPLDYYRILGLPIQATAEQVQQAYRDRTQQLPRREYSDAAIASRRSLIDEAYTVLSSSDKRRAYDTKFLTSGYENETPAGVVGINGGVELGAIATDPMLDPYAPSIEVHDQQLVGALLILLELGEYELVLKLGHPYLANSAFSGSAGRLGQADVTRSDVVLTLAFAYLELGREQWQQGQYETAAESLEAGQELLLREGLYASVRGEMQADLYKLRPYRILELLALPEAHEIERGQGINLLRDMLQDRGGIDGTGDDHSGLNVDDFLRFVQQLRGYLTATEQHALFESEARRPSAVATYLAVYALLARGFAYRQPALIRRAKLMLMRLGGRQDVYLEQAVGSLLLGQTEDASRALERSQEYESLTFIREHSQGSPDLLPGLCLYAERWLQNEVFPHFRDLAQQRASLKDYFADEQVQAYLEELPNEPEVSQWEAPAAAPTAYAPPLHRSEAANGGRGRYEQLGSPVFTGGMATATVTPMPAYRGNGATTVPTAERVSQLSPEGRLGSGESRRRHAPVTTPAASSRRSAPASGLSGSVPSPLTRGSLGRQAPRLDRLMFLLALGVLGLGVCWLLFNWLTKAVFSGPKLEGEQLSVGLNQPVVQLPPPTTATPAPAANAPLTVETATQVLQTWLRAKAASMGQTYDATGLPQILAEPILSERQEAAEVVKASGTYRQFNHSIRDVKVLSADTASQAPGTAQVEAAVTEAMTTYRGGQPEGLPESDQGYYRYYLVQQGGQWKIQDIETIEGPSPTGQPSASSSPPAALDPAATEVTPGTIDAPEAGTFSPAAPSDLQNTAPVNPGAAGAGSSSVPGTAPTSP